MFERTKLRNTSHSRVRLEGFFKLYSLVSEWLLSKPLTSSHNETTTAFCLYSNAYAYIINNFSILLSYTQYFFFGKSCFIFWLFRITLHWSKVFFLRSQFSIYMFAFYYINFYILFLVRQPKNLLYSLKNHKKKNKNPSRFRLFVL